MLKFLIIDNHPLFREGMQVALRALHPKAEIREAGSIDDALDLLSDLGGDCDLALVDPSMPGAVGVEGLLSMRTRFPRLPILVVSGADDPPAVREAFACGVSGFVSKAAKRVEITRAVSVVLSGSTHMPEWCERVVPVTGGIEACEVGSRLSSLTPQQMRVLQMLQQGKLNKQIAHELDVGETTVKAHVSEVLRKLGVVSRTQAVIEAAKVGSRRGEDEPSLRR